MEEPNWIIEVGGNGKPDGWWYKRNKGGKKPISGFYVDPEHYKTIDPALDENSPEYFFECLKIWAKIKNNNMRIL